MTDTILVVAPHGLDEVLGCGGAVARLVAEGATAHLLVLNGDGTGRDEARRVVTRKVANTLEFAYVTFGGFPENSSDTVDRKCLVMGKSVTGRVDFGCRRYLKK